MLELFEVRHWSLIRTVLTHVYWLTLRLPSGHLTRIDATVSPTGRWSHHPPQPSLGQVTLLWRLFFTFTAITSIFLLWLRPLGPRYLNICPATSIHLPRLLA